MLLLIVGCCCLMSCDEATDTRRLNQNNSSSVALHSLGVFESYVNTFNEEHLRYKNAELPALQLAKISFVDDIPGPVVGRCFLRDRRIEIEKNYWKYASESMRESLIYHELGHCYLNRDHFDVQRGRVPVSLMNTVLVEARHFDSFRNEYLEELFTKRTGQFSNVGVASLREDREARKRARKKHDELCTVVH